MGRRLIRRLPGAALALIVLLPPAGVAFGAGNAPEVQQGAPVPAQQNSPLVPPATEPEASFELNEIRLYGNTIFSSEVLLSVLDEVYGSNRTAADVERARDLLEQYYHDQGYPTVLVNIPEQTAEGGSIQLQVIESRIGAIRISGNRYFPRRQLLALLPSVAPGSILFLPAVQAEIGRVNRTPDLKVVPSMAPGKEPGTVDVELKVEDRLPVHGFLEINNRNSANTSLLRLNGGIHYDNLWNRLHSLSFQYQMSPQNPDEVEVFSGSYTLPAPWNVDHSLVVYGVKSDSQSAFGEGFHTLGKGNIIGTRWIIPLPPVGTYGHSAVMGFDYKKFEEVTGSASAGETNTPVEYLPASISYSASLPDAQGLTLFTAGMNLSFRGAVARKESFEEKRFKARGNYISATAGIERRQELLAGMGFLFKADGQMADQPLISNEQFSAGGMESVRGYRESSLMGDKAFHATVELSAPDLAQKMKLGESFRIVPYLFYDCAALWTKDPLPSQDSSADLQGTGVGVRGVLFKDLEYQVDFAYALSDTSTIKTGDSMVHFRVKYQF